MLDGDKKNKLIFWQFVQANFSSDKNKREESFSKTIFPSFPSRHAV